MTLLVALMLTAPFAAVGAWWTWFPSAAHPALPQDRPVRLLEREEWDGDADRTGRPVDWEEEGWCQ